jgi:hypothetical protein
MRPPYKIVDEIRPLLNFYPIHPLNRDAQIRPVLNASSIFFEERTTIRLPTKDYNDECNHDQNTAVPMINKNPVSMINYRCAHDQNTAVPMINIPLCP